ncbi:hypothetical protein LTR84_008507 [Exophiala bonariae]|uniref:Exosome complex protein n=1 Tax=Exophiala bonariae TaxID=1690606 RepID=A0AAV9MWX1_9EURO|nr:hypothetical protein LTR84_008507 [Exophiala bonariae]
MAFNPWQDILDQHVSIVTLLEAHASLLVDSMSQHVTGESSAQKLLETRLEKTEGLILFFRESASALGEISNATANGQSQSSAPITEPPTNLHPSTAPEPTVDASGLFSVDTNPTPFEHLYQPKNDEQPSRSGLKRKIADLEAPFEAIGLSDQQHTPKKQRSHVQPNRVVQDADDFFDRGVEAKLKAKAERKKARENKKRKRGSDTSSSRVTVKGPKNKKQKQIHDMKIEYGVQMSQGPKRQNSDGKKSNAETSNGGKQPNKKRKKSR